MAPARYKLLLQKHGLTQQQAGLLFGHGQRAGQSWAGRRGPPPLVAMVLNLMDHIDLDVKGLNRIMPEAGHIDTLPTDLGMLLAVMCYFAIDARELNRIMRANAADTRAVLAPARTRRQRP